LNSLIQISLSNPEGIGDYLEVLRAALKVASLVTHCLSFLIQESGSFLNKPLTDVQRQQLIEAARTTEAVNHVESKLCENPYELKTGRPVEAARGLVNRLNVNMSEFYQLMSKETDGIIEEVTNFAKEFEDPAAKEVLELLQYILYEKTSEKEYPNGTRDKGRVGKDLIYFITHTKAQQAQLKQPEVVALRLYTTAAFRFMNGPLRDDMRHEDGRACPLPVTTCFAVEGIKKLRAHNLKEGAAADSQTFWRGMRNLRYDSVIAEVISLRSCNNGSKQASK
jgi:hypothetical protein